MSLKTCMRIIPSLVRHTNSKQLSILQNCNLLCKNNAYIVSPNLSNYLHNVRFLSTTDAKMKKDSESVQVYYGTLTPQIRGVKLFSLLTSFTGLAAQPFLYNAITTVQNIPLIVVAYSFVGFFTLGTPFLLHYITKKYITSLTYKPETGTYVAKTLNILNMEKELEFTPDDVKVPDVPGMFTSFLVKGNPLFVDPRLFQDPRHYGKLMGFDKPLDLKLFETSLNEKPK